MKVTLIELADEASNALVPLFVSAVSAGFPSPADDYVEAAIDLNKHLIKRPAATFLARASGDSMVELGIQHGDLLVVDRSLAPAHHDVVIAALNNEMVCKVLDLKRGYFLAANGRYKPIKVTDELDVIVEGVVTHSIRYHRVRPG